MNSHAVVLDPASNEDLPLAAALIARSQGAAAVAWTRLAPLVLSILRRYTDTGEDRRDLCQEVFLRFFARIGELRNHAALRSFIVGICLGVAQNELRRARVRRRIVFSATGELPEVAVSGADPESREAALRLYRILATASVEDRSLFVMRHELKMELAEIATETGRPLSTTSRHVGRATRRIVARMQRDPALADLARGLDVQGTSARRPRRAR